MYHRNPKTKSNSELEKCNGFIQLSSKAVKYILAFVMLIGNGGGRLADLFRERE